MTVRLGMFSMPFHHSARDYADFLEEDQEGHRSDDAIRAARRRDTSEMRC